MLAEHVTGLNGLSTFFFFADFFAHDRFFFAAPFGCDVELLWLIASVLAECFASVVCCSSSLLSSQSSHSDARLRREWLAISQYFR